MTTEEQELRELDAWIEENVFLRKVDWDAGRRKHGPGWLWYDKATNTAGRVLEYSTSHAYSLTVLEKCVEKLPMYLTVAKDADGYYIDRPDEDSSEGVMAKTLPLAICQFAKKLFEE